MKKGNLLRVDRWDSGSAVDFNFQGEAQRKFMDALSSVKGVLFACAGAESTESGSGGLLLQILENPEVPTSSDYTRIFQGEGGSIFMAEGAVSETDYAVIFQDELPSVLKAPNILRIVSTDVDEDLEENFNRWYDEEHLPYLQTVDGVLTTMRGVKIKGTGQKYMALYFHENIHIQKTEAYQSSVKTKWAGEILPRTKNASSYNYEILHSQFGKVQQP